MVPSHGRSGLPVIVLAVAALVYSADIMDKLKPDEKKTYESLNEYNKSLAHRYYNCQDLSDTVNSKAIPFLNRFGEAITLAVGSTLSTKEQIDAAVKYTETCTGDVVAGPTPKNVLLLKWNMNGDYIYPGTLWCGAGNKSREGPGHYGNNTETDKCCEKHDNATDYMLSRAYHEKSQLTNPKYYTVTNCSDDVKLFDCLLNDNSNASLEFGQAFFDALRVPCLAHTYKRSCEYWKDGIPYVPRDCAEWKNTTEKHWTLIEPPNFYYTFMRKWHNETYEAAMDPYSWKKACILDKQLGCSNYTWITGNGKDTAQ